MNALLKFQPFLIVLLCSNILSASQKDRLFYDAVRAEAAGDIESAIQSYIDASKISHSSNLHGNLANLFFKKGQYGHSILHFKKAILLNSKNSELVSNLNFAYEMAGVLPLEKKLRNTYFSNEFFSFWIIITCITIWIGAMVTLYFLFYKTNIYPLLYLVPLWIILSILSGYSTFLSSEQHSMLLREIIVVEGTEEEEKEKNSISLRRFAGEKSTTNTTVMTGESLFVDLNNDGSNKSHKIADGRTWFLVRSFDGKKKGWIKEDKFGWIIEPENN